MKGGKRTADDWEAAGLQLVAFPVVSPIDIKQNWFEELIGQKAEQIIEKRTDKTYSGPMNDAILVQIAADLLKVTISISPSPVQSAESTDPISQGPFFTLGMFSEASEILRRLATGWLDLDHPPIKRLAIAGKMLQKAKHHREAYMTLAKYLTEVRVDPSSTDFLYRVNRRRATTSGIRGLEINRLTTWNCLRFAVRILSDPASASPPMEQNDSYVASLEFDINTAPERTDELPKKKLKRLLQEFIELAHEICEKGDVK